MKKNIVNQAYGLVKSKPYQAFYGIAMAAYLVFAFYNVMLGIREKRGKLNETEQE